MACGINDTPENVPKGIPVWRDSKLLSNRENTFMEATEADCLQHTKETHQGTGHTPRYQAHTKETGTHQGNGHTPRKRAHTKETGTHQGTGHTPRKRAHTKETGTHQENGHTPRKRAHTKETHKGKTDSWKSVVLAKCVCPYDKFRSYDNWPTMSATNTSLKLTTPCRLLILAERHHVGY